MSMLFCKDTVLTAQAVQLLLVMICSLEHTHPYSRKGSSPNWLLLRSNARMPAQSPSVMGTCVSLLLDASSSANDVIFPISLGSDISMLSQRSKTCSGIWHTSRGNSVSWFELLTMRSCLLEFVETCVNFTKTWRVQTMTLKNIQLFTDYWVSAKPRHYKQ